MQSDITQVTLIAGADVESIPYGENPEDASKTLGFYVTFLTFLVIFFLCEAIVERYHPIIGHQTVFTVVLGIIWSGIFYWINGPNETLREIYQFKQNVFFDFFLPPIIFNSGFNMRRKKFFMNIGNIMIFGLFVTLVCFTIYSVSSSLCLEYLNLEMT